MRSQIEASQVIKVLFFCSANSCRSPAAAGIFRAVVKEMGLDDRFFVESAGTHAAFGRSADLETVRVARTFGVELDDHRSRPLEPGDFREFDLLVGMDQANIDAARGLASAKDAHKLVRLLEVVPTSPTHDVPDPYRAVDGFAGVHRLIECGVRHLVSEIRRRYGLS